MPRREILAEQDKEAFDSPPIFNSIERKRFFDLTPRVQAILQTLHTPSNAVAFLVRLGYFKATKRFFGRGLRQEDVEHVARKLGFLPELIDVDEAHNATVLNHREIILDYLGFKEFGAAKKDSLANDIRCMVRSQASPQFILRQVVEILEHRKVEVPSSWVLSELILYEIHLSQHLADEDDPKHPEQLLAAIKNGSVVTWQHINLHGEYDFSDENLQDSVGLETPKIKALSLV